MHSYPENETRARIPESKRETRDGYLSRHGSLFASTIHRSHLPTDESLAS